MNETKERECLKCGAAIESGGWCETCLEKSRQEKTAQAAKCYKYITVELGRRSCSGCHLDAYCQMPKDTYRWLFEEFLPAIDPSGQTFGYPKKQ